MKHALVALVLLATLDAGSFAESQPRALPAGSADNQRTPPAGGVQSQDAALGEPYLEGAIYPGGARIALDEAGHVVSVQAGTGRMADFGDAPLFVVLATISGPATRWGFSFGKEASALSLVVDGKRFAPVEAQFAAPVVAALDPAAKPERSRRRTDGETIVIDTTEHPLAILFRLPDKALRAQEKTLSVRGLELAGQRYTFELRFVD